MPTRFLRQLAASDRERFLESMLESATDYAIITLDAAGLITGWTGGAEAILGWGEAEVLGRYTDLFSRLRIEPRASRRGRWPLLVGWEKQPASAGTSGRTAAASGPMGP